MVLTVFTNTLGKEFLLPKRKISSLEEFFELFPVAKEVFIDSTERPRRRPKDAEKQKKHYYSGKKKHPGSL